MKKIVSFSVMLLFLFIGIYSETADNIKSIKEKLATDNPLEKLHTLIELAEYYKYDTVELSFFYASQAQRLASKLEIDSIIGKSFLLMAHTKLELGDFYESKEYLLNAQKIFTDLHNNQKLAGINYNLGITEFYLGNYKESIENYQNSLTYFIEKENIQNLANIYQNIGVVHRKMENYEKALEYYEKALVINDSLNNELNIAGITQNIGLVYINQELYDTALHYIKTSLNIYIKIDDKEGIGRSYSNMGAIYQNMGDFDETLSCYSKAYEIFSEKNYQIGIIYALHNLGNLYLDLEEFDKSLSYFQKSLELSKKSNHVESIVFNYKLISDLYEKAGDYKKSLGYYVRYNEIKDSLKTFESRNKVAELEGLYNFELKEKELAKKNAELKQERTQKNVFILGFGFLLIAIFVIYYAYRKKKVVEKELKEHRENLEKLVEQRTKELNIEISERKIAEESDKLKSAFLSNMSHELRTPMNAIIAFSNFLKDIDLSKEKRIEYINYITSAGDSLLQLIDDIIDCAKIEAGHISINKTFCSVTDIFIELQHIFNELKIKKKKKNIDIRIDPAYLKKNVFIETDPIRLKQILNNLLENALKYTFRGYIEYGFDNIEGYLKFYVKDTGIGIKKEKQDFIFERFAQIYTASDKKYDGTGLGLSISKNLVELLGGKIWIESELNIGSIFYFLIPYKEIKIENRIKTEDSAITRKRTKCNYDWNNKIILIAEDEELNFKVLESALAHTNANILRASDGLEAVNIAKKNKCNLILMDIQMPNMDGYIATKEIKRIDSSLPIIAQTSFAMTGDKNKCFEAGCDDYLSKPFNLNELLLKINKYIS